VVIFLPMTDVDRSTSADVLLWKSGKATCRYVTCDDGKSEIALTIDGHVVNQRFADTNDAAEYAIATLHSHNTR
jgi:hydrogenase maturation factor